MNWSKGKKSNFSLPCINECLRAFFEDNPLFTSLGDSGGPMYKYNSKNEIFEQYGTIHGSEESCDGSHFPGIYIKLTDNSVLEFLKSNGTKRGKPIYRKGRHIFNL